MESKVCTRCGEERPLSDYHYANKARDIKKSVCKDCSYLYAKEHIEKDPVAFHHYMKRYAAKTIMRKKDFKTSTPVYSL